MADVVLLVGLGFGDECKGSIVDHWCHRNQVHTVVRYNGGAQCGHNVVLKDGRHHTFAQFGSGTFVPGVRTHLSRYMLVNPIFMTQEEKHLREMGVTDAFDRMTVELSALVTNPFQVAANRLREMARSCGARADNYSFSDQGRHGSCGMGIGETMADWLANPADAIYVEDLENPVVLRRKLSLSQDRKREELALITCLADDSVDMEREWGMLDDPSLVDYCAEHYAQFAKLVKFVDESHLSRVLEEDGTVVFEGAQGVLLDQDWGFHPYTTWTDTTLGNAYKLLDTPTFDGKVTKMGVLRAYATRHGPGPFPTEAPLALADTHNGFGKWQRDFRVGHFDLVMARYALDVVGGVNEIVMTCVDRVKPLGNWNVCTGYALPEVLRAKMTPFFRINNGLVEGFKPPPVNDLAAREKFTGQLMEVKPVCETFSDLDEMITEVGQDLKTPITLCSFGPTAEDKRPRC